MSHVLIYVAVFFPLVMGLVSLLIRFRGEREIHLYHFIVITLSAIAVWVVALMDTGDTLLWLHFKDGIEMTFRVDGAGKILSCLSATLWVLTTLYAFEYFQGENCPPSFWSFFTASFGVTIGIAYAGTILAMYLFYELLTLCTIPLVLHYRRDKDVRATQRYMIFSFGGAALALCAVVYLLLQDGNSFVLGGHMSTWVEEPIALVMFLFGFFGFGVKAAIFPMQSWLPAASVAPTPVTALLHAVAVVKAGAFAVIRLTYYAFGTEKLFGSYAQYIAMAFAAFTIVYGSVQALRQQHFKRRLAYSTVSNLSYILLAASLMSPAGLVAAFAHIVVHSVTKIVGFFAAGSVLRVTEREYLEDMNGLGKRMPGTFLCFFITALSLTGIPGLGGFTSKWLIGSAAVENGSWMEYVGLGALLISALLTGIYMFTVVVRTTFPKDGTLSEGLEQVRDSGWKMLLPMGICCLLMVATGVLAGPFVTLLKEVLL